MIQFLVALAIFYQDDLMERLTGAMDAFEKWMTIRFTPNEPNHHPTKMDVLPKSKYFCSNHLCCQMVSAAFKYVPHPPSSHRRPLPSFLSLSFFYGQDSCRRSHWSTGVHSHCPKINFNFCIKTEPDMFEADVYIYM